MSKQSWRAGVCVLLTDSVCVEVSVCVCVCVCVGYECALYASCDLCLLAAAAAAPGPRRFETPLQSTVESNRPL